MSDIQPFGTSTDSPTLDGINTGNLKVIKCFGCTVVDFNVSADWGSQAGSLDLTLIEDEAAGDRLKIPVIGSPFLFELEQTIDGVDTVVFEYLGIVESFGRSATTSSKTYSASLTSPLKILEATKVVMNGYTGLGGSLEGNATWDGYDYIDFGTRNADIEVMSDDVSDYASHWFNVSNLINVFGILENDHPNYRVPFAFTNDGNFFGDFGYSAASADGIPLIKLMWGLHIGINHMPKLSDDDRQQTHGGNLLYGRHNYDINGSFMGIPYFYDFDALGFYNQIKDQLGPEYRVPGEVTSLNGIISHLCNEANFEYLIYIDINKNEGFGDQTLREFDDNWNKRSNCSWKGLDERKFTDGGHYGGTIRVQTMDKNNFFNDRRPFSNIAYNLLGLEVPDLKVSDFTNSAASHPGKRPGQKNYGLADNDGTYMDPLDSEGLDSEDSGFTEVGTKSLAEGGILPSTTDIFDKDQMNNIKVVNSNISLAASDTVTMKVVVGGYQTRIVQVPRSLVKHYWGDISLIGTATDPRTTNDTATDTFGLDETSVRKIPVVTQLLDPRDIDDFVLIDMQSIFGDLTVANTFYHGVYAASVYEIRNAMAGFKNWLSFFETYKPTKFRNLINTYFPDCINSANKRSKRKAAKKKLNSAGGLGYEGAAEKTGAANPNTKADTDSDNLRQGVSKSGEFLDFLKSGGFVGIPDPCRRADSQVRTQVLPKIHEKIKDIGDTHYGKSWYAPVPYFKTKLDHDGDNLVGNFTRSWHLDGSAYVEPSLYYVGEIPQSNQFIQDGKVSPFVNYDNDFVYNNSNKFFDDTYVADLESPINGVGTQVFNFSEYNIDALCTTKYADRTITHAAPENISQEYSFLPYAYESFYNRSIIQYSDMMDGLRKFYPNTMLNDYIIGAIKDIHNQRSTTASPKLNRNPTASDTPSTTNPDPGGLAYAGLPLATENNVFNALANISALDYADNGEFCFPFVKVTTSRVFLPVMKNSNNMNQMPSMKGWQSFMGMLGASGMSGIQPSVNDAFRTTNLKPFPACVCPRSINYAQKSTRYVYGPWITNIKEIAFRGTIEYEQDESLVPENFLIPLNFGQFGDFQLNQISGLTGLNLAAQGRANAIDDFALFAQEQGSITIQAPPAIKRIGDSLYGVQQVSDVKVSVGNASISTTYSFKTISPRFGRNNKDIERRLTKISNAVKKLKLT